jgi:hypothetical protein
MDLEKLLNLVLSNPDNIEISYSNVNGRESLIVNGKELIGEDSLIKEYKDNIDKLDDCVFVDVLDEVGQVIDLKEFDKLLNKKERTSEESKQVHDQINYVYSVVRKKVKEKIKELSELLDKF